MKDSKDTTTNTTTAPEEAVELVTMLTELQTQFAVTDEQFASRFLSYSSTVWGRIKSGEYWTMVQDSKKAISRLRMDLRNIQSARLHESRAAAKFITHPDAQLVLDAVSEARVKPVSDPNRCILHLAPTGGGKTTLGLRLRADGARVVEARESWLKSYFSALRDIAQALSIDVSKHTSPDRIEDELVSRLSGRRVTLVIDEGEFFGSRTLNLVKLLLNKTPVVIVICAIPEAFEQWARKNWHEASQLRRRTHALIRLGLDDSAIKPFFRGYGLDEKCVSVIGRFARAFGAFDTVCQIRAELEQGKGVTPAELIEIGNRVRMRQGLHEILTEK